MVVVTDKIEDQKHDRIAAKIYETALSTPSLTPRSRHELDSALKRGDIALAFDDNSLIGWVVSTPHTKTCQELGMAFVHPDYRGKGIFIKLMDSLVNKHQVTIAATYEQRLAEILIENWDFETTTLTQLFIHSKGRFITSRLKSLQKAIAVSKHLHKQKPIYLIRVTE